MKTVSILGATGSIGQSTLDLVKRSPDQYRVLALTAARDVEGLAAAAKATNAQLAVIADEALYDALKSALAGTNIGIAAGPQALVDAARLEADWTMAAIVGCAGLAPTLAALETGKTVALANKEALVSAGDLMLAVARRTGATLLPTDSEHNAVFQCLDQSAPKGIAKIILTASGGPFRTWSHEQMRAAQPEQALKHPNWSMGAKISVDSATMMNKGLELIEAAILFDVPADRIEVTVHPQSIVHSMVTFTDGATIAQASPPSMRLPISLALAWPHRVPGAQTPLDVTTASTWEFEPLDDEVFPAVRVARAAVAAGGSMPAVYNAANEEAAVEFLAGALPFPRIVDTVEAVLEACPHLDAAPRDMADVVEAEREARAVAHERMAPWLSH